MVILKNQEYHDIKMQIYKNILISNKFMKNCFVIIILVLFSTSLFSQNDKLTKIADLENRIFLNFQKMDSEENDSISLALSEINIKLFEEIFTYDESWEYPYTQLKNRVSVLNSDDKLVKIITWNIVFQNASFQYFGFVLHKKDKKSINFEYFILNDKSDEIKNPKIENLNPENWFGALYYEIITMESGKNKYYTLLGWDGNNKLTTKKIIEVVTFNRKGEPKFGSSFPINGGFEQRVIFEYRKGVDMVLRYNKRKKMIIFDFLAPSDPKYEGIYQYYVPTSSWDGLFFENGKWNYQQEVDVRNKK